MQTASPRLALLRSCAGTSAADQVNHAWHTHAPMSHVHMGPAAARAHSSSTSNYRKKMPVGRRCTTVASALAVASL